MDDNRKTIGRVRSKASFPAKVGKNLLPSDYATVLSELKERIRSERLRVTLAANSAMVLLYWDIGQVILQRQQQQGWGTTTGFKTSYGCDRLQSSWIGVVGKKGSQRASARFRALFTSGLYHELFAQSRYKTGFETSCKVIDRLSADLQKAFPDMKGLSPRNLKYMGKFAQSWPDREIVQEPLAQITWYQGHRGTGSGTGSWN